MKNEITRFIEANNMVVDKQALISLRKDRSIQVRNKNKLYKLTDVYGYGDETTYLLSKISLDDLVYLLSSLLLVTDSIKDTYTVLNSLGLIEEVDFDGEFDVSDIM